MQVEETPKQTSCSNVQLYTQKWHAGIAADCLLTVAANTGVRLVCGHSPGAHPLVARPSSWVVLHAAGRNMPCDSASYVEPVQVNFLHRVLYFLEYKEHKTSTKSIFTQYILLCLVHTVAA